MLAEFNCQDNSLFRRILCTDNRRNRDLIGVLNERNISVDILFFCIHPLTSHEERQTETGKHLTVMDKQKIIAKTRWVKYIRREPIKNTLESNK